MIVMNGRFILLLAILPVFISSGSTLDLRAIKFAERNGDCFVDVYQPDTKEPEPLTNFFIRQSFKSLCYRDHIVRSFNLLPNGTGGYRFTGCFYFQEKQTLKCERFEQNKFVQYFDVACNNPSVFKNNKVAIFIKHDKFEVYNNKDVCALESWKDYVPHFYPESLGYWQYNAVLNKYDHLPSKAFEEYFSFGKVEIQKHDFPKFEIRESQTIWTKWTMNYEYVFDDLQAPGKVELPFSRTFYGIKYVVEGPNKCFVVISDVNNTKKNKRIKIDCSGPDVAVSFGIFKDTDGKYRLRACFLEYFNVIPSIECFALKNETFVKDFSYSFQSCYFVAGEIDAEHCTYYEDTDVPPNIMWGSFNGKSKQLNGIMIDYAGQSCELEIKNGKNVDKETQISAKEFGRGFDVIRDDYLTRSNLSFILDSRKEDFNKTSPIMSTGSNIFIKGANGNFVYFDPRGNNDVINDDYLAIVDNFFIKLL